VERYRWIAELPTPLRAVRSIRSIEPGRGTVELEWREWMGGLAGAAAIAADDALCIALVSLFPGRNVAITVELGVDVLRFPEVTPRTLIAHGHAVAEGEDDGVARGTVEAPDGVVLAETSLRALIIPHEDGNHPPAPAEVAEPGPAEPPRASPFFANPRGVVHGGALTMLAARVAAGALAPNPPTGIRATLTRPLPADGGLLETAADVVHAGRRLGLANVTVGRDGAVAAALTATALGPPAVGAAASRSNLHSERSHDGSSS
jgi:acyl-coenzyme A thioesterase PaaI-like protein